MKATCDFKAALGLERSISCSDWTSMTDDQRLICEQVKDFDIDEIYFSTDENKSYPAVFIKKVSQFDTNTLKEIAQIHKYIWNYQKVLFLYVYSDAEIRIYNCTSKPFVVHKNTDYCKELEKIELQKAEVQDKEALSKLATLFSSVAIDTGIVWTLPEAIEIRKKINLQKRVDKYLVDSLTKTTKDLKELGLTDVTIIHKIILRSLFLLYLEDRGATGKDFYHTIKNGAETYFDILEDVDATYSLFAKLEEQFNGNVFSVVDGERELVEQKHLQIIRKCFINGYEGDGQTELFSDWRLFDFNIIQIELLSEIYERFLAESDKKKKKNAGAFYTPPSLVTLILDEVLPIGKKYTNYNVKILDPACGSGIFLVESYKRLLKRYENAHNEKLTDFNKLNKILKDNIFGIEQNDQAIIVAAFSLYLALVDNLDPKTLWISTKLPCLINDSNLPKKKCGKNLFCRDTIAQNDEIESIQFDLVVGNPPFGTENKSKGVILSSTIRDYCNKYGFAKEMVLPFMHKAVRFSPTGKIALIFNAKVLTNTKPSYQNFRQWLLNDCYVEKIYNFSILRNASKDFGGQLFGAATGPICIAFYRKEKPNNPTDRIIYYAPKTYIKSNVLEGVVIDSSDVKYLPREACQKSDTRIWKIAMWGGNKDIALIEKLMRYETTVNSFIKTENCSYGVGFQPYNTSTNRPIINNEIADIPYIKPENIIRYFSSSNQKCNIKYALKDKETIALNLKYYGVKSIEEIPRLNIFRREGAKEVYSGPMLLIKEGLTNKRICASVLPESTTFNSTVLGIKSVKINDLRLLSALINSRLATYYLLMTSSSWGMERERIKPNEVYSFPIVMNGESIELINKLHESIEKTNEFEENIIKDIEDKLDSIIESQYQLSKKEMALINDFVNVTTSLLYDKENSEALFPESNFCKYVEMLKSELNDFLENSDLCANGTTYTISPHASLAVVKISLEQYNCENIESAENIDAVLSLLSKKLWEAKGQNIFFRKKLTYYDENNIYIIRPNQKRFWTESMAMEDALEIILDILNMEG